MSNVKVCDIEDDVKDALKKFRFRKNDSNAALILKVEREKQKICIDQIVENVSIDELRDILPSHQPRYVVYSYKMEHKDGRVSFPMCFIYITPRDSQMELQIMYAGTKLALQKEADLTRVYEVRELEEFTEDWLKEKLKIKQPWQVNFESEHIDDEKWSCIVAAIIESKPGDEECLRMLSQSAVSSGNSPIHIIDMSELIRFVKQDKNRGEIEKSEKKGEKLNVGKTKKRSTNEMAFPVPRFREVLTLISKHAIYSDGQCILPPELMAYALKYIILYKKDIDCFLRRRKNLERLKREETEIREEITKKLGLTIAKKPAEEQSVEGEKQESNASKSIDFAWTRSRFDLLDGSESERPFNGPEIYVMLSEFYDPLYFTELLRINVPFAAVIKIEDRYSSAGTNVAAKKVELINGFWMELEKIISRRETTETLKDVAMLKFSVPQKGYRTSPDGREAAVLEDLTAMMFSAFHVKRLHERYIQQMKVHRMIESLEPLDLSKCSVYTNLCDILIEDNFNVELFVLFSIIEQVVSGVPETKNRAHEYAIDIPDDVSVKSRTDPERHSTCEDGSFGEEKYSGGPEFDEVHFSTEFLASVLKDKDDKSNESESNQCTSPLICFHGDSVLPQLFSADQRVMKPREALQRFLINSVGCRVWRRFPKMSPAEEAWSEYQFFRLWKTSRETEESLRVKLLFAIAMKLIGNSKFFVDTSLSDESGMGSVCDGSTCEELSSESKGVALTKPDFFMDVANLFYRRKSSESFVERCKNNPNLKKAEANSSLVSPLSSESDSSPKVFLTYRKPDDNRIVEDVEDDTETVPELENVLDFQDISFLIEPSLFSDYAVFKAFISKYCFFEELESNRMAQQLEQCHENYNSLQYIYFPPTDTLFVLASNEVDPQGMSESSKRGFLLTPVSLRDFCQYVLFENEAWRTNEDAEYIEFLKEIKEKAECEKAKKRHDYKCCLLKKLYSVSEEERMKMLGAAGEMESTWKTKSCEKVKNAAATDERKKERLTTNVEEDGILGEDAEDGPTSKAKQLTQGEAAFCGINCGNLRIEVDERSHQFHSKDGTFVSVEIETWLYGKTLVSMSIEKRDAKFTVHVTKENEEQKLFHFKNKTGTWITFSEAKQFESNVEEEAFLCTATCPSGLMVQPRFLSDSATVYVKQSYHPSYRRENGIKSEKFRCCLSNGQIVIFRVNGVVDVLCPGGTKYVCHKFTEKKHEEGTRTATGEGGESGGGRGTCTPTGEEFEAESYHVLTPNGEFWVRDEKCKRVYLAKTVKVLAGRDPETEELFLRREDGTSCMLWQDGKLVTTFPDGTKITSIPKFEEEPIAVEESDQSLGETPSHRSAENGNSAFSGAEIAFSANDEAFTSVTCSYLLEHPKYATVHCADSAPEITLPEHMEIQVVSLGNYNIKTRQSALQILGGTAKFHSSCDLCGKRSTSKIFLTPLPPSDLLSETQDFFDNKLTVYSRGELSFEAAKNSGDECTESPESASPVESAESCSIGDASRGNMLPQPCHHAGQKFFDGRCFAVQRDLSGIEFIDQENLAEYIAGLSESAYYDLGQIDDKTIFKQHSFFDLLHERGNKRWMMPYKENDSHPANIKRKDVLALNEKGSLQTEVRPTFPGVRVNAENMDAQKGYQRPHAVIARFIRVLHTKPHDVIKEINLLVSLHQKIAFDILTRYKSRSNKNKQHVINEYVAKELELIASAFSQSMDLYPHTCTAVPNTDLDIHSVAHKLRLNEHIAQENPNNLSKCKQICDLLRLRRKGKGPAISETDS